MVKSEDPGAEESLIQQASDVLATKLLMPVVLNPALVSN